MIRVLFGSRASVLGLGLAAAFAGPDLVTGAWRRRRWWLPPPSMRPSCTRASRAGLRARRCSSRPASRRRSICGRASSVVAFALRPDGSDMEVGCAIFPGDPGAPTTTVAASLRRSGPARRGAQGSRRLRRPTPAARRRCSTDDRRSSASAPKIGPLPPSDASILGGGELPDPPCDRLQRRFGRAGVRARRPAQGPAARRRRCRRARPSRRARDRRR